MPKISEHDIQRAVCIWLDGTPTRAGALRPGVVYWHTPNGGSRDAREGARFKQIGVLPGIPDLWFLASGLLFGLELKDENGKLSSAQRELHPRLRVAGVAGLATVNTLAAAKAQIVAWGLAFP